MDRIYSLTVTNFTIFVLHSLLTSNGRIYLHVEKNVPVVHTNYLLIILASSVLIFNEFETLGTCILIFLPRKAGQQRLYSTTLKYLNKKNLFGFFSHLSYTISKTKKDTLYRQKKNLVFITKMYKDKRCEDDLSFDLN